MLTRFHGSDRTLAAQAAALPQPDQLCGPFAACLALHALLEPEEVPSLLRLARAAGTAIWPYDEPAARPAGTTSSQLGWAELTPATSPAGSGTDAVGLATGIIGLTRGAVAVVPIRRPASASWPAAELLALLGDVAAAPYPVSVVANIATGPVAPPAAGPAWEVGHFVVLWGVDADTGQVALADSYVELTGPEDPPGCRMVTATALGRALGDGPGRGLLLLTDPEHAVLLAERAVELGMILETWRT